MYWAYERARVLLVLDRAEEAIVAIDAALARARWQGQWPIFGVLRTRIWALRALGRNRDADAALEEMKSLPHREDFRHFVARLIAEAEGPFRTDGIVY